MSSARLVLQPHPGRRWLAAGLLAGLLCVSCSGPPPPFPVEVEPIWRVSASCERNLVLRARGPDGLELRHGEETKWFWQHAREPAELPVEDPPLDGGRLRVRASRGEGSGTLRVVIPKAPPAVRVEADPLATGDDARGSLVATYPDAAGLEPTTSEWSASLGDGLRLQVPVRGCGLAAAIAGESPAGGGRLTAEVEQARLVARPMVWHRDPPPLVEVDSRAKLEQRQRMPLADGVASIALAAEISLAPWVARARGQAAAGAAPYQPGKPAPLLALMGPGDLRASALDIRLDDLVLLATAQARRERQGSCGPYSGAGSSPAYFENFRGFGDVEITERASGRVIARRTFREEEGECPWQTVHVVGGETSIGGTFPEKAITEWLAAIASGAAVLGAAPERSR